MRRLSRFVLPLVVLVLVASGSLVPAHAAVPDVWVKWNLGDHWIRSLDYVTPGLLVAGSETDGVYSASTAAGPWTDITGNLPTLGKQVHQAVGKDGQIYLATSAGLYKGSGNGSWAQLGVAASTPQPQRLDQGGVQSAIFPTSDASTIVVGTAGSGRDGAFFSTDSGAKWTKAGGLTGAVFHLTTNGVVSWASTSTGFYVSSDGKSWQLRSDGIPPGETAKRVAISSVGGVLVAGTTGGVYRSTNGGLTWSDANGTGGPAVLNASDVRAIQLVPSAYWNDGLPRIIAGTNNGVWATQDGGASWFRLSPTKAINDGLSMHNESVYALALGFGAPGSLMVGTQGHGIYTLPLQLAEAPASIPAPTGTPVQNQVLTAQTGVWAGTSPYVYSYQWKRCNQSSSNDSAGNTCSSISGATDATYQVDAADVGKHLRVGVRARSLVMPLSSAEKLSASVGPIAAPAGAIPTPPSGFPRVDGDDSAPWGATFTVQTGGSWNSNGNPTATTFAYRWYRCAANGTGCELMPHTASTYTSTVEDVGHTIAAYVIGTIGATSSDERFAGLSGAVFERKPVNTAAPRVVGPAYVGTALQSTAGAWTGTDPSFTRRWFRCNAQGTSCSLISPLVTTPTYTVKSADLGSTFRVEVTATVTDQFQARTETATSGRSAKAGPPPPTCAQLKAAITKAQAGVTAAKKALAKAKKAPKKKRAAKVKAAKKKLRAANAALAAAKARYNAADYC